MNTKVKGILAILISAIGFSFMAVFFSSIRRFTRISKITRSKFRSHVYSVILYS